MINYVFLNDFFVQGKIDATSCKPARDFTMNKVDDGWTLALDIRYRGTFETFNLAMAELQRLERLS